MSLSRTLAGLAAAAVLAAATTPALAQGQGQGRGQSQGQGQGESQGQSQSQGQGQSQGRGDSQGQGKSGSQGQGQGGGQQGGGPGGGGPSPGGPGGNDGDFALEAVRSGRALPLADILATVRQTVAGAVIDARLVLIRGFLVYEVKSMTGDGQVSRSYYYARSGRKVGTD